MSTEPSAVAVVEEPIPPAPGNFYEMMGQLVRDPSVDPVRLQQFMELREREEARQAEREFTAAMNRLQPKLPRISKRGRIEFAAKNTGVVQSTPFAKYEDAWAVIGPLLLAEGFTVKFGTGQLAEKGLGILIKITLTHVAGHKEVDSIPLPYDNTGSKNSIQSVGSTLSYGKRYLLFAVLNIITEGEDDDGNALSFLDPQQVNNLIDLQSAAEMDVASKAKFLIVMKADKLENIHKHDYAKAVNLLNQKLRKLQEDRNR